MGVYMLMLPLNYYFVSKIPLRIFFSTDYMTFKSCSLAVSSFTSETALASIGSDKIWSSLLFKFTEFNWFLLVVAEDLQTLTLIKVEFSWGMGTAFDYFLTLKC